MASGLEPPFNVPPPDSGGYHTLRSDCGELSCQGMVSVISYPMALEHRLVETLQSTLKVYQEILKEYDASSGCDGILGCLCFGGGDWLMIYGDPTYTGKLKWLMIGAATIPQWIYIGYGFGVSGDHSIWRAFFAVQDYITDEKKKKKFRDS